MNQSTFEEIATTAALFCCARTLCDRMSGVRTIKLFNKSILQSSYALKGQESRFLRLLACPCFVAPPTDEPFLDERAILKGLSDFL